MAQKWNLQDIRPATPRSARPSTPVKRMQPDIAPRTPTPRESPRPPVESFSSDPDLGTIDIIDGRAAKRKRLFVTILTVTLILGAGFILNTMLGGATITVEPKQQTVTVGRDITAYRAPERVTDLAYELLTLEAEAESQVKATGKTAVSERAQGEILIYNTQSVTQRLIKNTRFESSDGKIFRISDSLEVPAASRNAQGVMAPGVITARVMADGPGIEYNLPPGRFTVPGLKGSPQFEAVYAESTSAFSGGFEGERFNIPPEELQKATQALQTTLRNQLLEKLSSETLPGFVVYPEAVAVSFVSQPTVAVGEDLALIREKAQLHVPIFKVSDLATFIARDGVRGFDNAPVSITDPRALRFSYTSATTTFSDLSGRQELSFKLEGRAQIVWQFDAEALRRDMAGMPKEALASYLRDQRSLERASSVVKPVWKTRFPDDPADIAITILIDGQPTPTP